MSVQESSGLAGTVILGIDDQEDNLQFLRSVLESRKVTFFGTTNSTECFGLAGRVQPRVVLLDIQMPGMDGFETCRRLRTMREVQETPIIFLTGRKTVEDVKCGVAAGGNDFIAKPFDPEKLLSRVEYWGEPGRQGTALKSADLALGRHAGIRRVLLAQDIDVNAIVAETLLDGAGYHLTCVTNGEDAVEAVRTDQFDLVLMDVQMPGMNGLQASRKIRSEIPSAKSTPIVAMTANPISEDKEACLAAGMADFITKPIDPDAFLAVISRFMGVEPLFDEQTPECASSLDIPDVDPAKLDALADVLPASRIDELLKAYIASSRSRLDAMQGLAVTLDYAGIAREAHDLKSNSGNFGATRVQMLTEELERACQSRDAAGVPRLLGEIISASKIVRETFEMRLSRGLTSLHSGG